jgi:hypothetical protein
MHRQTTERPGNSHKRTLLRSYRGYIATGYRFRPVRVCSRCSKPLAAGSPMRWFAGLEDTSIINQ